MANAFIFAFALLYAAAALQPALARDDFGIRDIMVEEGGRPLKRSPRPVVEESDKPVQKRTEPKARPRGSSYIPPTTLPRTVAPTVGQPSPGVYKPPPINSFGDRVINCNHSFPLNAGIGNNPTDRSSYVRQCAN